MKKIKLALALSAAVAITGCVSPQITEEAHAQITFAEQKVRTNLKKIDPVQTKADWERAQEVDAPFIVGKSVPLARSVTLPRPLQKGVKTALMFPEQWVSLSTVAERIMLATGIVVTISQDVYLDRDALSRRSDKASTAPPASFAPMPTGLAPTPLPTPIGNNATGTPAGLYASSASKPAPSANGFDFPRAEAELGQILDLVATKLSINWRYDEASNSIKFYRLVTKSWQTPFSSSNSQYSTILDGSTSSSSNTNALASKTSAAPISSVQKEMNELTSIRDSVEKSVMTKAGEIAANPATGTITITDTADAIEAADGLIRSEIKVLSRIVLLKVQTIKVTVNKSGESSVNLAAAISRALKNLPDLSLSLDSPAPLTSSNAASLGLNIFSGPAAGSSAVIRALQEIGDVQTSTEIPISTRNRHAIYYNVRNTFSYVAATTAAAATAGGTGGTPGITTAQDSVGLKLMMYPNIMSKDNVMLTMAMDQSILQSLPTFSSGSGANLQSVQLPNVDGEGSSQEVPIRNGQTIVLTGFDRTANQYDKRTLGDNIPVLLGGSLRSSQTRSTTIVLVSVAIRDIE